MTRRTFVAGIAKLHVIIEGTGECGFDRFCPLFVLVGLLEAKFLERGWG
jgi:hypothetical protein